MAFKIRLAAKKDLPACIKILRKEFNMQGEEWTVGSARGRLAELMNNSPDLCFCIELDGKIIGLVFAERFKYTKGNYLWISEFVIEKKQQGKGFGFQALKFMEATAKEKGFRVITLTTNVGWKAYKIYEKFGFKNTNYYFMEKELPK